MACKGDITVAWGWLSLADLDVDLPEPELDGKSQDSLEIPEDRVRALRPLLENLVFKNLGRFLQ